MAKDILKIVSTGELCVDEGSDTVIDGISAIVPIVGCVNVTHPLNDNQQIRALR